MAHFQCSEEKTVSSDDCYKCFKEKMKWKFLSRVICKANHIVQAEGEVVEPIISQITLNKRYI